MSLWRNLTIRKLIIVNLNECGESQPIIYNYTILYVYVLMQFICIHIWILAYTTCRLYILMLTNSLSNVLEKNIKLVVVLLCT